MNSAVSIAHQSSRCFFGVQVELDKKLASLLAFRSQSLKIHAQHRIAEIEDLKKQAGPSLDPETECTLGWPDCW